MTPVVRVIALPSGPALVQLTGELDLAVVPALQDGFADALTVSSALLVDLRGVTFLDAAVIGSMVRARQQALAEQGSLSLVGPSPRITRILRAAQAAEALPSFAHLSSALRASGIDEAFAPAL